MQSPVHSTPSPNKQHPRENAFSAETHQIVCPDCQQDILLIIHPNGATTVATKVHSKLKKWKEPDREVEIKAEDIAKFLNKKMELVFKFKE